MALACLCHGVSERRVKREIDHGAATIEEVAERCRAGSGCFGCHSTLERLLEEHAEHAVPAGTPRRRRFQLA